MLKYIVANKSMGSDNHKPWMNVHVIGGYGRTVKHFQALVKELKKTFPEAKDCDIECNIIVDSGSVKNCSMVVWGGYIDMTKVPDYKGAGWYVNESGKTEYRWT